MLVGAIIKYVEAENLLEVDNISGDKLTKLRTIFQRLYDKNHPVRKNLYLLDSIEAIRVIEGKA